MKIKKKLLALTIGHKASGAQVLLESSAAKQHAKSLIWLG